MRDASKQKVMAKRNWKARQWALASLATILVLALCATASLHQRIAVTEELDLIAGELQTLFGDHITTYHEPYVNRWQQRFSSQSGYLFFKHIRKAGGTSIRDYLFAAMKYHGHGTLKQFMETNDKEEVMRHAPLLSSQQIESAKQYYSNQTKNMSPEKPDKPKVYYIEQEFSAMDWSCRQTDPRWNTSLSVIVLRHPIERQFSEYFYTGPPSTGVFEGKQFSKQTGSKFVLDERLQIDRSKLYKNTTYTHALSMFLQKHLLSWAESKSHMTSMKWYFGHHYTDNFQLRALAGCASGECLDAKNVTGKSRTSIEKYRPATNATTATIDSACTMHPFYLTGRYANSLKKCERNAKVCPNACDGPCFYPAAAWGRLDETDLSHAIHALEGFDIILLTETMNDIDQLAFLADAMGVPRNVSKSTSKSSSSKANINTKKSNRREKTHYYRDLMSNLTYPHLVDSLFEENRLEIDLYHHAVRLNKLMTDKWKREVNWSDDGEQ